jgi:hypothetical protein
MVNVLMFRSINLKQRFGRGHTQDREGIESKEALSISGNDKDWQPDYALRPRFDRSGHGR